MYSFAKAKPTKKRRFDIWERLDMALYAFYEGVFRLVYLAFAIGVIIGIGALAFLGVDALVDFIWPNH